MASKTQDDVVTPDPEAPLKFPTRDDLEHTKTMDEVIQNAKNATDAEHNMTLWQGIKLYPKAVGWSILISTCIVMEGYDVCLLSNFCESYNWSGNLTL
jgi:SP family general alpha glucoside:H+ symporter-like MFS transporter